MPTPQTGTFRIKAGSVQSKATTGGTWQNAYSGGIADPDLVSAVNAVNPATDAVLGLISTPGEIATIQFDSDSTAIILNEGTPDEETITFAALPAGFTVVTATLTGWVLGNGNNEQVFFRHSVLDEDAAVTATLTPVLHGFPYDMVGPPIPTMLDVVNNGFGWRIVDAIGGGVDIGADTVFDGIPANVYGTYEIQSFQYTLDPVSGSEVDIGETITITSPGTDPTTDLDLSHLTISTACGTIVPSIQTQQLLVFTIPLTCSGAGASNIIATGDGFQFTGPVTLGSLTILTVNASGIYTLVPGKGNDTLYSGARDGSTFDVKIPDPFAKTGFVGG